MNFDLKCLLYYARMFHVHHRIKCIHKEVAYAKKYLLGKIFSPIFIISLLTGFPICIQIQKYNRFNSIVSTSPVCFRGNVWKKLDCQLSLSEVFVVDFSSCFHRMEFFFKPLLFYDSALYRCSKISSPKMYYFIRR